MDFMVRQGVLIPRPETAELVEWITLDHAAQQVKILDLGTGSGCIAISLSKQLPLAKVEACDISPEALAVAKENNERNGATISFFAYDMLERTTPLPHSYNILVSNPPYIMQSEAAEMEKHVTEWEPHTALFVPDNDPLLFYRIIAGKGLTILKPGGRLYFEINRAHGKETMEMLAALGYTGIELRKDFAENDRMIRAVKN